MSTSRRGPWTPRALPRRRTISGMWLAANDSTRSSASAAATVGAPAVPGTLAPERGSARTGHPKVSASRRTTSGVPAPAPATIKPLAAGRASPTRASSEAGSGTRRTPPARCQGRPLRRPGGSSSGVVEQRLAKSEVGVHGTGSHGTDRRLGDEPAAERPPAPPATIVGNAGLGEEADRPREQPRLLDGLGRADVMQLGRPVGGAHDHRHPGRGAPPPRPRGPRPRRCRSW